MIIYGITVCRNEQDIIEPFVRHNLKFVDKMFIMDNASVDATKSILLQLSQEFPQVIVSHDDAFGDTMESRNNSLLQLCKGADFVVPIDADEFITATNRESFEQVLQLIPSGGFGVTPWVTAVTCVNASDPPRSILGVRNTPCHKVIINLKDNDPKGSYLHLGNHEATGEHIDLPLQLLHVPIRSKAQLIGKICVSWMAYLKFNNKARNEEANWHKRYIFDLIKNGFSNDTLDKVLSIYCPNLDTIPCLVAFDYERKYSDGIPMEAWRLIMKAWEQSES